MKRYKYLIVGGGMTAAAAIQGLRQLDQESSIGLISAEHHLPYDRPPLSKGLWKGKAFESIWREVPEERVELHLGRRVVSIDLGGRTVVDDQDDEYGYEKILLATGGTPRRLPFGGDAILYYRTLDDYYKLREINEERQPVAVIGGGFIGSEIAAALAMNGQDVTMAFPEPGIGARIFPPDLALYLNEYYRQNGVEVLDGEMMAGLEMREGRFVLNSRSGREIAAGSVVAGIGIHPNIELAQASGLEAGDGILVDRYLRTSQPDVYAAGDVASFYNPALAKRIRVEHEDNANAMGRIAGQNMAGDSTPYDYLPYFYSDLFDLGYEAVGDLNSELEIFADWQEPYQKGVVYYLEGGRVRGVLLWNVWDQVEAARQLISEPGPFGDQDLKGRIPG